MQQQYALLDSGDGQKFERFGRYTLVRPAGQAIGRPQLSKDVWKKADAWFTREEGCRWLKKIEGEWIVDILGIKFRLSPTDFGHLGVFPEQKELWEWVKEQIHQGQKELNRPLKALNLFAYSGGATMIAAREGAHVCHLDASKGMVSWAKENARLNRLDDKPIRWMIDDVKKFLLRELRRESFYDAIILDPPTFGKGSQGQIFKFESDLYELLDMCRALLSSEPRFILLSCHTPNISPIGLRNTLHQVMAEKGGVIEDGELLLRGEESIYPLPNGIYARWTHGK